MNCPDPADPPGVTPPGAPHLDPHDGRGLGTARPPWSWGRGTEWVPPTPAPPRPGPSSDLGTVGAGCPHPRMGAPHCSCPPSLCSAPAWLYPPPSCFQCSQLQPGPGRATSGRLTGATVGAAGQGRPRPCARRSTHCTHCSPWGRWVVPRVGAGCSMLLCDPLGAARNGQRARRSMQQRISVQHTACNALHARVGCSMWRAVQRAACNVQ